MRKYKCHTLVIGSGAAGYSAAHRLNQQGIKDILILTNGKNKGTSRNTGSDKQTYYKLNLCGNEADSVLNLAADIFNGGACDGDNALAEAASSARCYYTLLELGVPFVLNEMGEACGYLTDHGCGQRATSAGPLTSKYMTEFLEDKVKSGNIEIMDGYYAQSLIADHDKCYGVVAYDIKTDEPIAVIAQNTILATGGPALVYGKSVYPYSQVGAMALAVKAGAQLQNITEWQFGLASTEFRWNLSGSYQQSLPRYYSVDEAGNVYDFLMDGFHNLYDMINSIFLKGYQWPFDARKAINGSSRVDLLVHEEILKSRRVYMDFTQNPWPQDKTFHEIFINLSQECRQYLQKTNALGETPLERLLSINKLAYKLYKDNGIDLAHKSMQIQMSSQHMNGGISVDSNWESSIKNLYAIGEAAGTHGVYRPGGSALNAGQVGALRASMHISKKCDIDLSSIEKQAIDTALNLYNEALTSETQSVKTNSDTMDKTSYIREYSTVVESIRQLSNSDYTPPEINSNLSKLIAFDTAICQLAILNVIKDYIQNKGSSRGSYLIKDASGDLPKGIVTHSKSKYLFNNNTFADKIQVVRYVNNSFNIHWRNVRKIPQVERTFENLLE